MNAKTLKALEASIEHWKRMRADINCGESPVAAPCPLCRKFKRAYGGHGGCKACPLGSCAGTSRSPYSAAYFAWASCPGYGGPRDTRKWKRCATNMIRYMQRRLPKKGGK